MRYPVFDAIELMRYPCINGFQTLGFVAQHRPDIYMVHDQTSNNFNEKIIASEIENGLAQDRPVGLFFFDEDFIGNYQELKPLRRCLERYRQEPVYLCTSVDGPSLMMYTSPHHHDLPIKILTLPWVSLNMILSMAVMASKPMQVNASGYNFACYQNRSEWHRDQLISGICARKLDQIGDVWYQGRRVNTNECTEYPYLNNSDRDGWTTSHDMKKSLTWDQELHVWHCHLGKNIPRLRTMLQDTPMVLMTESNMGLFAMYEKTYWPILLGRLFLTFARAGFMAEVQKLVTFDLGDCWNLEFDSIEGWTQPEQMRRLDCMLDNNLYQIRHSRDLYAVYEKDLQASAANLPRLMYDRFCNALDQLR